MKARYQYRFYPTDQQRQSLARLFGCVRVVYNDALAICKQSEKKPKSAELQKIVITQAKKTEERAWLSEVSNIPLQQSVADARDCLQELLRLLQRQEERLLLLAILNLKNELPASLRGLLVEDSLLKAMRFI